MNKWDFLIQEYVNLLKKEFDDFNVLLYGSTAYKVLNSDFDVCILKEKYDDEDKNKIKNLTISFHKTNNLKLDLDMPYEQKCIYSFEDMDKVIKKPPFKKEKGLYKLMPVKMSEDYLQSDEMKNRLLLNILTTDSKLIYGIDELKVNDYKNQAWKTLVGLIYSSKNNMYLTKQDCLNTILKDDVSLAEGKSFLGYSKNNEKQINYLTKQFDSTINNLVEEQELIRKGNAYKPSKTLIE